MNTPCGRLRSAWPSRPNSIRSLKSWRTAFAFNEIVWPGRIVNSSGSPGTCLTTDESAPGRISSVNFGLSASWMSPSVPRSRTISLPATVATARTFTALSAASSGAAASAAAESTPIAARWPASISIGPWKVNPAGRFSSSIRTGPSKPSMRVTVNVSSRPLPGLTFGSLPATVTSNAGFGRRMPSV